MSLPREFDVKTQATVHDVWQLIGNFEELPRWDMCVRSADVAPDGYWRVVTSKGQVIYGCPCYSEGAGFCSVSTVWEYDDGSLAMQDSWHVHDRGAVRNINYTLASFKRKGCLLSCLPNQKAAACGVSDKNELFLSTHFK